MKKKILALVMTLLIFCTTSSVFATAITTEVTVFLNTKGENFEEMVEVIFKPKTGETIKCLIDKNMGLKRNVNLNVNEPYEVTAEFGNGKGEFGDYHFLLSDGGKTFTPTETKNQVTLILSKKGAEKEALKSRDYKAEGAKLFADYKEIAKSFETLPQWQKGLEERYELNTTNAEYALTSFLETDKNNTKELWEKMTLQERYDYDMLVAKPKRIIIKDEASSYESFNNTYNYDNSCFDMRKNGQVRAANFAAIDVGKEVAENGYNSLKEMTKWLFDTYQAEHVFVNILDIENTAPVASEPEPEKVEQTIASKPTNSVSSAPVTVSQTTEPEKAENGFVKFLKNNWFTLVIIVGAGSAFLIVRHIRKKKSIEDVE